MSKVLYVGDPHARPEDLADCQALCGLIVEVIAGQEIDRIVFLGDLHHTHAIVHVEVLHFWRDTLRWLTRVHQQKVVLLVGNHDQPGDASSSAHALEAYKDIEGVTVVDRPLCIDGILHLPYRHSRDQFVADCSDVAHRNLETVVCHQTFDGAQYENGFFAKDGVKPDDIPQKHIISGHIHDPQSFSKVTYLGSPRWLTISDANKSRFLSIVYHDENGVPVGTKTFPTDGQCRKIFHLVDTPEAPLEASFDPRHRYHVDVTGPAEWIEQRKGLYTGHARVRTQRTDNAVARVRESEGIGAALRRFIKTYKAQRGTDLPTLERLVDARLSSRSI